MSSPPGFAAGSRWAFAGKMGSLACVFASNALLARTVSPAALGVYFLVLSIARVAILVGQVGMNQAVVRFIAGSLAIGDKARARQTVRKAFVIVAVGGTAIGLLYLLFDGVMARALFNAPVMGTVGVPVFCWIVAGAFRILAAECFRGFDDLRFASLFELLAFELLFAVFVLIAWAGGWNLDFHGAILLSTAAALLSAALAVILLAQRVRRLPVDPAPPPLVLLSVGWPLLVSNLVVVVMTQAGLWIVGMIGSPDEVALYGAAFRLVMLLQLPLLVLNSVIPQLVAQLYAQEKNREIEGALRLAALAAFIPIALAYVLFLTLGGGILSLVFGAFYADAHVMLAFLGLGVLVNGWAGFCGPALMMTGKQVALMKISLFTGLPTLGAAFFCGHRFGAEGVAAAMAAGIAGQHVLMVLTARRLLGVRTDAGNLPGLLRMVFRYGA